MNNPVLKEVDNCRDCPFSYPLSIYIKRCNLNDKIFYSERIGIPPEAPEKCPLRETEIAVKLKD